MFSLSESINRISTLSIVSTLVLICALPSSNTFAQTTSRTSKERAKKHDFDASLQTPCAQVQGEQMGVCTVKIARDNHGDATLVVTFSNGFNRTLYFIDGEFTRANATMSGVGTNSEWVIVDGIHLIRVDDQRFEIPVAFVKGNSK